MPYRCSRWDLEQIVRENSPKHYVERNLKWVHIELCRTIGVSECRGGVWRAPEVAEKAAESYPGSASKNENEIFEK